MALISGGILVLVTILGHDFSGHYNRLALICVDIISGVYCIDTDGAKRMAVIPKKEREKKCHSFRPPLYVVHI